MIARAALLFVLVLARVAAAASPADELLERGLRSYAVGRYDDAIASFQRGYELAPRADFLYALGQAQRMNGDCRAAVASYRAYLRTSPPERAALPARQNLERCEAELANAPPPTPAIIEPQPATPPTAAATPAPPPRRRARDDRAAALLAGFGGAALVAGGALWGVGEAGARSLANAATYDQFAAHGHDADAFAAERTAGIVAVAVGGALVTVAVARWSWIATHR
jgi:tetratricopeptide (TPR) repeat protein